MHYIKGPDEAGISCLSRADFCVHIMNPTLVNLMYTAVAISVLFHTESDYLSICSIIFCHMPCSKWHVCFNNFCCFQWCLQKSILSLKLTSINKPLNQPGIFLVTGNLMYPISFFPTGTNASNLGSNYNYILNVYWCIVFSHSSFTHLCVKSLNSIL